MRTLTHREVKSLAQGCTASQEQSWSLNFVSPSLAASVPNHCDTITFLDITHAD